MVMKISGFSYIRNGFTYGYPFLKSIQSILPICDEFVIAVGDSTDGTREAIVELGSPKIKIIDTIWDENLRRGGEIFAQQCNAAGDAITGDWGFHIQADEVVHENDLEKIEGAMKRYLDDPRVEGLLFDFLNFYGSYDYIGSTRRWHRREIRIVRNNKHIRSYRDSQGFRLFDLSNNMGPDETGRKLLVKRINACIYHYSYVRPPSLMQKKARYFNSFWHDDDWLKQNMPDENEFDYYEVDEVVPFTGTHPQAMREIILNHDPSFEVSNIRRNFTPREWLLHRIEKLTGYRIGEYKNYKII
jgi:glycosyltransferase involved in cell wall biosynthesis